MNQAKRIMPRMSIEPSRVSAVPKEDIDRLRKAMEERVIKPWLARRGMQARLIEQARRRVVFSAESNG